MAENGSGFEIALRYAECAAAGPLDGRLLLGLGTSRKTQRISWEHSYLLFLLDPSQMIHLPLLETGSAPSEPEEGYQHSCRLLSVPRHWAWEKTTSFLFSMNTERKNFIAV